MLDEMAVCVSALVSSFPFRNPSFPVSTQSACQAGALHDLYGEALRILWRQYAVTTYGASCRFTMHGYSSMGILAALVRCACYARCVDGGLRISFTLKRGLLRDAGSSYSISTNEPQKNLLTFCTRLKTLLEHRTVCCEWPKGAVSGLQHFVTG